MNPLSPRSFCFWLCCEEIVLVLHFCWSGHVFLSTVGVQWYGRIFRWQKISQYMVFNYYYYYYHHQLQWHIKEWKTRLNTVYFTKYYVLTVMKLNSFFKNKSMCKVSLKNNKNVKRIRKLCILSEKRKLRGRKRQDLQKS